MRGQIKRLFCPCPLPPRLSSSLFPLRLLTAALIAASRGRPTSHPTVAVGAGLGRRRRRGWREVRTCTADAAVAPARTPHASCSRRIEPWRRAAPATATPVPRRAVAGHLRPLCARRPPHCFPVQLTTHLTSLLLPSVSSQSGRSPPCPAVALLAGFPRSPTPHRQGRPHPLPEPPAPSSFSLLAATPLFFFLLCLEAATRTEPAKLASLSPLFSNPSPQQPHQLPTLRSEPSMPSSGHRLAGKQRFPSSRCATGRHGRLHAAGHVRPGFFVHITLS